uniref:polynucleotide adenylyltransferase n=1 Tax=Meloidogyne javanica TaxID=6303 RepID=A0A915MLH1_MELJA
MQSIIDKSGNLEKFQFVTKTLKLWAKNHFIYSSQFGFLNGATLNLLILKIVLLYFDSSQIYLLQKFLETFSECKYEIKIFRDWKYPVKLEELTQKSQSWKEET